MNINGNKVIGIIQARMGSTRFPGKMSADLGGYPIIDWVIRRSKRSQLVHKLVLATSTLSENDYLVERAKKYSITSYQGSENNVLSRFVQVAKKENAGVIVRICADNPFICGNEIDRIVKLFLTKKPDYAFNHIPGMGNNYVDGIGAEVFSLKTLTKIADNAIGAAHLEHVTKFLWDHSTDFTIETIRAPVGLNHTEISLDIDTSEDLEYIDNHLSNIREKEIIPELFNVKILLNNIKINKGNNE